MSNIRGRDASDRAPTTRDQAARSCVRYRVCLLGCLPPKLQNDLLMRSSVPLGGVQVGRVKFERNYNLGYETVWNVPVSPS
jgi:hypothetical protein